MSKIHRLNFIIKTTKGLKMNRYLGVVIILLVIGGGITMGGGLERAVDLLSLIFVIGVGTVSYTHLTLPTNRIL